MQNASGEKSVSKGLSIEAGLAYFAIVFPIAFAFGIFRTLVLAPAIGKMAAVITELPFLLAVSWISSLWLISRFNVPASLVARLTMGGVAFAVLMVAEVCFSVFVFGQPLIQYLEAYQGAAGQLGLAGQIAFAILPSMQLLRTRPAPSR
jgi:hypothetical protein